MRLEFSDEQVLFADAIGRFVAQECSYEQLRREIAAGERNAAPHWQGLAELGCFALAVPEAAGGLGGSAVDVGIMARALGGGLAPDPVRAAIEASLLLAGAPSAEGALAGLMAGEARYAVASDASGGAQVVPGGWAAGGLVAVSGADLLLIPATAISAQPLRLLDDSLGARLSFDPAAAERHPVTDPDAAARGAAMAAVYLAYDALGSAAAALEQTAAHVHERRQFGRALAAFQVVEHKLAEMAVALQEIEAAAMLAALVLDTSGPGAAADRARHSALTTIACNARGVAEAAVQLHGGMGVSDETPVAAHFRRLSAFSVLAAPMIRAAAAVIDQCPWRRSAVLLES